MKSSLISSQSIQTFMTPSNSNNDGNASNDDCMINSWGEIQEWALRDNISKYTVNIPKLANCAGGGSNGVEYAMWRCLLRDIVELTGYEIQFVHQMYQRQLQKERLTKVLSPGVLPLLDDFQFLPNGGVSGRIQGLPGISDGTTVQTSPLTNVELTLPKGYILTDDGSTAYELGAPLSNVAGGESVTGNVSKKLMKGMDETTSDLFNSISKASDVPYDALKIFGTPTAIMCGGVIAANLLSHHLTVNVFWV